MPTTYRTSPVRVTLSAVDELGGSGVADTYYTVGTTPSTPTTASAEYDPADKPTLGDGERIAYFSVDEAGNAEQVKTSRAAIVAPATNLFRAAIAGTVGFHPYAVAVADVTGDGRPDLVTANFLGDNVSVIARNAAGTGWEPTSTAGAVGSGPQAVAVADVTGDGRPDLVTANVTSNDVSVIARNAAGTGWEPASTAATVGSAPRSVAVADVTGDGRPDLITANSNSDDVSVIARNGTGDGWLPATTAGTVGDGPQSVVVADVTGDGRPDLVTADLLGDGVSVIARNGTGTGWEPAASAGAVGFGPRSVRVADVTGDGRADLITGNSSSISVLARNADGTGWEPAATTTLDQYPNGMTVADVTGDDRPDVITANFAGSGVGTASVLARNATGSGWQPAATTATGTARGESSDAVAVADVTGDGRPDVITANASSHSVSVLTASADVTAPTTTDDVPTGYRASPVRVTLSATDPGTDASGVARTLYTTGVVPPTPTVLSPVYDPADKPTLNDGERISYFSVDHAGNQGPVRTSRAAVVVPAANHYVHEIAGTTGLGPAGIAVADVTGDGRPDLVTANAQGNSTSIVARSGAGTGWDAPLTLGVNVGIAPSAVTIADVNRDGLPDLLTANAGSNDVMVRTRRSDDTGWGMGLINGHAGTSPSALAVADVAGTGRPYLVVANRGSNDVTVLIRDDSGAAWFPPNTLSVGANEPIAVAVADVTGDGRPDIVTANQGSDDVTVIARHGTLATWLPATTISTGDQPTALAVADVTGDGRPDIVTANRGSNDVTVIARNGTGTGWEPAAVVGATGGGRYSVAVADMTGDGRPDIVTAGFDHGDVSLIARNGTGTGWDSRSLIGTIDGGPASLAVTDVTGDGRPDVITANQSSNDVSVLVAAHDGTAPSTSDDVDGDWHDAPVPVTLTATDPGTDPSGVATTFYETGVVPTTPTVLSPVYDPASKPTLDDGERIAYFTVDRAGNAEAVRTSSAAKVDHAAPVTTDDVPAFYRTSSVRVTLNAVDAGSGVADVYYTVGASPEAPTTASATYDPADKPVLSDGERISYFSVDDLGNVEAVKTSRAVVVAPETTHHTSAIASTTSEFARSVAVGDVTGDGRPDLVTTTQDNKVLVIARNGTGTGWVSRTTAGTTGEGPFSVAIADVTGDGRPDLITSNAVDGNVTVIARNASGTGWEAPAIAGTTGALPNGIAVADVTGDGRPDLFTSNSGSDDVSVIARNETGTGWEASTIAGTTGSDPRSVAVGDVTGDGQPDLVTANLGSSDVSVIARNGSGTGWEAGTIAGATGNAPHSVTIGDVTGDGRPDLVTANSGSGNVSVIARNGSGTGWEAGTTVGTTGNVPTAVAIADVNGDGRPDLVAANAYSDNVAVIARNGTGSGWEASVIAGATGARPYSLAVGDVTGDGRPDLVTANLDGRSVSVLTAHHDGTPPTTTDDVPATHRSAPVRVTLTASDDPGDPSSSGVKDTYYTVGTTPVTPTTSSATYDPASKPTLNDGERISYFSVDHVGNTEAVKTSAAAEVDQDAPTTSDDVDSQWHDAPVAVTLAATDAPGGSGVAATHYTVGATPATPTTSSPTYDPASKPTLNHGEKIAYFSVDRAGNAEAVRTSLAAKVDTTVPDTTITAGPAPLGTETRPSISFSSAAADATFECALNGGPFAACASPFRPATALADGSYRFDVRAISRAGLVDPTPASATFVVDTTPPAAPGLVSGPPATSSDTTASIAFSVEPGAAATCSVDGGAFVACASPLVITGLTLGDHEVRVVQTDRAGHTGPELRVTFAVIAKPPPPEPPTPDPPSPDPPTPTPTPTPSRISLTTRSAPVRNATALLGARTPLNCAADSGSLRSCTVEVRSVKALKTTAGKRLPAGTVLARGTSSGDAAPSLAIDVRLTAAVRSVAARYPLGIDAQVMTTATTAAGATLNTSSRFAVLGNATVVLPVRSAGSAKLSAGSKRALAQLARTVGEATSVRCAAYTDNSRSASAARKLTTAQAQAACRYLAQRGLQATSPVKGHGAKRPRASNATAKGRAKNRRLEITVGS